MNTKKTFAVSISRQLGCGGAEIGQQIARELNLFYADQEIISRAAEQLSLLKEEVEQYDEKLRTFWEKFLKYSTFGPDLIVPAIPKALPTDAEIFKAQAGIIDEIAHQKSAVFIGRCAFYVLRDHPHHVKIYLHADLDSRIKYVMDQKNVNEEYARKVIVESDKDRSNYINTFTGADWADASIYDLSLNTGKIGIEKSAELIISFLKQIM